MADNNDWQDVEKDDWQDVPNSGQGPDQWDDLIKEYGIPALQSAGAGITQGLGAVSKAIDKYTGAPVRAGVYRAMQGKPEEAFGAAYEQFGADPTKAPSGKDIAYEAGLSEEPYIRTPIIMNPYTGKEGTLKVSPAGIAGAVGEMALDPTAYIPAGTIGKGLAKGALAASDALGAVGRKVTPKLGKMIARVPEETTRAYMARPKEISQTAKMYTAEDLKDIIDETVGAAKADVETTKGQSDLLRQQLKDKLRQKRSDLQRQTIPSDVVNEIQGSLENQKAVLGDLSLKADEALVKSGKEFTKKGLLQLIDSVGASAGDYIIGEARNNAVQKLKATRQRIEDSVPNFIPAKDMRDILQQIRADIDFDMNAGEFNSDLNRMRKEFSNRISDNLKNFVPEYSDYMSQMSQLAGSLEQMSKLFGSEKYPAKAYGTLQSIRKGGRQDIIDAIRRNAELTKNQMLSNTLGQYQRDAALINRFQRGDDLSKQLFPEDLARLQDMEATQKMAEDIYAPMSRIRPGSDKAQSVIRRFNQPTASIEDARALEAVGKSAGMDLPQIIKDKAIYDQFNKDATAGSRNVLMGTVLGQGQGITGATAGALLGGLADRYGGRIVRSGIDVGTSAKNVADRVINYLANDPGFAAKYGRYFAKGAVRGGTGFSLATHHLLMNNDPEYRKYFEEGAQ